jgi:hypothetical protein
MMPLNPRLMIAAASAASSILAFTAGAWWRGTQQDTNPTTATRTRTVLSAAADASGNGPAGSAASAPGSKSTERTLPGIKAVRDMTPEEIATRAEDIFALDDPVARMEAYTAFIRSLETNDQLEAAMAAFGKDFNPRERGREMSMLMTVWAQKDPEAALAHSLKMGDWRGGWAASTAISTWAKTDPDKAVAWAQAHPPENKDEGNHYLSAAISTIAKTNLESAASLALTMDRSEARGRVMDTLLDQFTKQRGIESAQSFVDKMEESSFKTGILSRLAGRLADKDPKQTAQWAANLPESEAKPRVMTELIERWANNDPNEAGAWLNNFPKSPQTDEPRERFAWKVAEKDPEAAIAWAGTISDDKRRSETMYRLARDWSRREPDAARGWLATDRQMPPDLRQRLLQRLDEPRG